jgi:hypothetical protein
MRKKEAEVHRAEEVEGIRGNGVEGINATARDIDVVERQRPDGREHEWRKQYETKFAN